MSATREIADRYQLIVVEDACQAHGAEYRGRKSGSLGSLGCFSFYPTKNLGVYGDGGMVVTDQKNLQERLRLLRCYGEKRKYHHALKGANSRLDELQAAILRVKLKYLDQWNAERRRRAQIYTAMLSGVDVIKPFERENVRHVYHLYVIRTRRRNRHIPEAAPPYELEPGLMWFMIETNSGRGLRSLLTERGGQPLGVIGHTCEGERQFGELTLWGPCTVRRLQPPGDTVTEVLFGPVASRNGRFKFVSYANKF